MTRPPSMTPAERLHAKTRVARNGCLEWTGSRNGSGYGQIWMSGRLVVAHRLAWELAHGGHVPEGLTIDHLCFNRCCVNPDHLEAVTMRDNVLRGMGPTAKNARKTHCHMGHPLSGNNLYVDSDGGRCCRECLRSYVRAWKRTNPEKVRASKRAYRIRHRAHQVPTREEG